MAVQVYNAPEAQNTQLDAARLNPGSAPNPMGAIGQGLTNAATGFEQIIQQAQTLQGEEALNQLREKQQEFTGKVKALRGKQAFDPDAYGGEAGASLQKTALGWFDGAAGEASQGLTGHAAQVFKMGAARFRVEFGGHVQQHEGMESAVVAKDTYTGALAVEDQNLSQNALGPDGRIQGDTIAQSLNRKVYAAEQLSTFLGEGKDSRDARILEARSGGHALVLDALLKRNDTAAARAYFDMNRGQMDPKVTSTMEGVIKEATLANSVQAHSDSITARNLPLDQQETEARKAMANNPEGLKLLLHDLDHRWEVRKKVETAAVQENTGKLWDMRFPTLPGQQAQGMPQIMRTPEWGALTGEQRNSLRSQWENYGRRNENDPSVQVERHLAYYNLINDPNFSKLTDNQIRAAQGSLGAPLATQVMADLQKLRTSPGKVQEVQLDSDVMHAVAKEMGLIKGDKPNDAEKAQLGALQAQMKQLQQASGKPWTYEGTRGLAKQLMTPVVTSRPWYWSDSKQPLFQLQQTTAIPQQFTDAMNAKAQAKGVQLPSSAEVYQLYFDYKGKGLVDEKGNVK